MGCAAHNMSGLCVFAAVSWFAVENRLQNFINRRYKNCIEFFVRNW